MNKHHLYTNLLMGVEESMEMYCDFRLLYQKTGATVYHLIYEPDSILTSCGVQPNTALYSDLI